MADKQIIIDGVDVSGCPYYIDSEGGCSSHDCECIKCVHNVCFYKDYKAKEQECEKLKNDNKELQYQLRCTTGREKEWERNCKFWDARCEKLQTELDQLKADLQEYQDWFDEFKVMFKYDGREPDGNDELYSCIEYMSNEYKQLKQTLTEIKEIAKEQCVCGVNCVDMKQILQKISEVEDVDNN